MGAESTDVTAGLGGFLAFFLLAVALYFLMRNMNARMRRMAYRDEVETRAVADDDGDDRGPEGAGTDGDDAGTDADDGGADGDDAGTDGPKQPESSGPHSGPQGGAVLG